MKIEVLDCTLRDGGYVNDWHFGDENAKQIVNQLSQTGVDYVEVGFIKLCDYVADKIQFCDMNQIAKLFRPSKQKLSLIVEVGYGYPVTSFPERNENTVDLVRVIMWKRMLDKGFDYCKELIAKGYEVGIQATRTEQYSDEEFVAFVEKFSELSPKSLYIVDTFGLLTEEKLLNYASIADNHLGDNIMLGYHAHNNMQQAFSNAVAMSKHSWNHDIMLDGSVLGMGRGAGNLPLELYLKYLNESHHENYNIEPLFDIADKYIMPFYRKSPWGYSMPYLLSAINGRNPSYVAHLVAKGLTIPQIEKVFKTMKANDVGITFDLEMCDKIVDEIVAHS